MVSDSLYGDAVSLATSRTMNLPWLCSSMDVAVDRRPLPDTLNGDGTRDPELTFDPAGYKLDARMKYSRLPLPPLSGSMAMI